MEADAAGAEPACASSHETLIREQFGRQAELFAQSPELHGDAQVMVLVNATRPEPTDIILDVACGPGTVVAAFAPNVRRAVGLDVTQAMLDQARTLASGRNLTNVEWRSGDVYALPFADEAFDVVTCRFALHHFENPRKALAEMARVCRPGGRVALCDAVAPADAAKAFAFNAMERHRDPSTVAFRPLSYLVDLFPAAGLQVASVIRFQVAYEAERLVAKSFPANDDRDSLRHMISELIASDAMELGTNASATKFIYPAAVLTAVRPDGGGCRRT